jgi:hypothetical protein
MIEERLEVEGRDDEGGSRDEIDDARDKQVIL